MASICDDVCMHILLKYSVVQQYYKKILLQSSGNTFSVCIAVSDTLAEQQKWNAFLLCHFNTMNIINNYKCSSPIQRELTVAFPWWQLCECTTMLHNTYMPMYYPWLDLTPFSVSHCPFVVLTVWVQLSSVMTGLMWLACHKSQTTSASFLIVSHSSWIWHGLSHKKSQ